MVDRLQFGWTVDPSGYRWTRCFGEGEHENRPQLALVPVEGGPVAGARASPLRPEPDAALFRNFAELRPDKAAVLAFANAHGNLHDGIELRPATRTESVSGSPLRGTLLATWLFQLSGAQRVIGLWDLLRAGDCERLAQHLQWQATAKGGMLIDFDSHPGGRGGGPALGFQRTRAVVASRDSEPELLKEFKPGDPLGPAWAYLQQDLDNHLYYVAGRDAADGLAAVAAWDPKRGRPALRFEAPTLLSAVWVQLADAISNDRTFGRCEGCGRWFEIGLDAARRHRRTCSNGCRSRKARERQARARQLHAAGESFEQIAEAVGSTATTVRKWITGFKE
jgi:hypothetical protein